MSVQKETLHSSRVIRVRSSFLLLNRHPALRQTQCQISEFRFDFLVSACYQLVCGRSFIRLK